ncbi:hypothetical protein [Nonomuraea sp. NPDC049725]|uniref:hypothetical protein n=1 Tax=Nonomuraea sp. NPDC049725 TaxID=3154508 RepID=UPI00342678B6
MNVREKGQGLAGEIQAELALWTDRTGSAAEVWALPAGAVPPRASEAVLSVVRLVLSAAEAHDPVPVVSLAVTLAASGLRLTVSFEAGGAADGTPLPEARMRAAFAEAGGTLKVAVSQSGGVTVSAAVAADRLR